MSINTTVLLIVSAVTLASFVALSWYAIQGEKFIDLTDDDLPKRKVRSDKGVPRGSYKKSK